MLMQPMFEYGFYEFLYGFKFNYTCHKILNTIRKQGTKTIWFIELNLVDVFEKLQHEVLLKKILFYTNERQIYDLICKILKVTYLNSFYSTNNKINKKDKIFQSFILRPLFINIFFDRFDKFVKNNLFFKYNFFKKNQLNIKYLKIVDKFVGTESNEIFIFFKKRVASFKLKKIRKAFCEVKKNQFFENRIKYYAADLNYKKFWYTRFYTHMLFGFIGSKQDAADIFEEIKADFEEELKMKIQSKKVGVNHYSDGVLFLGYWIFGNYNFTLNFAVQSRNSNCLKFSIPIKILIKFYANKGFFQIAKKGKNTKYVGRRVDKWIFLSRDEKVIKKFNFIMRTIANYYSGISYISVFYELWELFRRSAALTLAHRRKMRTVKSAFQRWSRDLAVSYKVINQNNFKICETKFEVPCIKYNYFKNLF